MRSTFHPFMPNGPAGDPAVWVDLPDAGCSVLLDLGSLDRLSNRKLMRVDRVVVTHTHMDHFVGFDHLLRLAIRRERELTVTGPPGFLRQVEGRIGAYTWNVIESYPIRLVVEEIDGETIRASRFTGSGGMRPEPLPERRFGGVVHAERSYSVRARLLDHGVPVLGVVLDEPEHLSVDPDALRRMGLKPGTWLADLKLAVRRRRAEGQKIQAETTAGELRTEDCGGLARRVLRRSAGQSLGYFTDLGYTPANIETVVDLAGGLDLMICEAAFLHADEERARQRHHLTARQAGELARATGAKLLAPFHFSPRYHGREQELIDEAAQAFGGPVTEVPPVL